MLILIGIIGGLFRDEGIVLKDLTSKWEPSDRSGKWLKLKPDYVRPGSDLDVLIIGLYCLPKVSVCLFANFSLGLTLHCQQEATMVLGDMEERWNIPPAT